MRKEKELFLKLLDKELEPSLGCTEPMAYALLAAVARKYAPGEVKRISMGCDAWNVIGVQAVGIPKANGKHGAYLSMALGVVAGNADLGTLVLDQITEADIKAAEELVARGVCSLELDAGDGNDVLYMKLTLETDQHTATVIMENEHVERGIVYIEADGKVILNNRASAKNTSKPLYKEVDYSVFTLDNIYDFCKTCDIKDLGKIKEAIKMNRRIAEDGMEKPLGLQTSRILLENVEKGSVPNTEISHIMAWTVSGVDARMGGSDYPAMINTGSGNQGIIVTMGPVSAADYLGRSEEEAIRAAAFSNLVNIWLDYHSQEFAYMSSQCYCSTVACIASACGVAYLHGDTKKQISDIVCGSLGIMPGIICDGAKPTCALRTMAGMMGTLEMMLMVEKGITVGSYDGLVNESPEVTINNIYRLQKESMGDRMQEFVWKIKKETNTIC